MKFRLSPAFTVDTEQNPWKTEGSLLGYIAGFIDGEGSIGFHMTKYASKNRKTKQIRPYLSIANTNLNILKFIKGYLAVGGSTYQVADATRWRECYSLRIEGLIRLKKVLQLLAPYLILKKKQAELTLEFAESRLRLYGGNPHRRPQKEPFDSRYSKRELEIVREVRALNPHKHNKFPESEVEAIFKEIGK